LTKSLFIDENFNFWRKVYFFDENFDFLTNVLMLRQNFDFLKFWPIIILNSKKGSLTQFAALDQDLLKTLDQALTSDELTGENAMEKAQQLYHMCKKWWKFSFCKFLLKVLVFFLNFFFLNFFFFEFFFFEFFFFEFFFTKFPGYENNWRAFDRAAKIWSIFKFSNNGYYSLSSTIRWRNATSIGIRLA